MKHLLAALMVLLPLAGAEASSELFPKLSPRATVSQTIGTTRIAIDYHRPQVRGRRIWGELVPFGHVWRTGANEATTISFSDPARVNGQPVPAGTYAIFSIPGTDHWTLIFNKRWRQFGAFEYQPKEDLIRFDVKAKPVKEHTEWLTYEIYPASRSGAYVDLYWEKLRVSFLVEVDVDSTVAARMKQAMSKAAPGDWKLYADAAEYLLEQEKDLHQAQVWVDKSIKIQENPTNLLVKGRLLRAFGQNAQAIQVLERALKLASSQRASGQVMGPIQAALDLCRKQNGGGASTPAQR